MQDARRTVIIEVSDPNMELGIEVAEAEYEGAPYQVEVLVVEVDGAAARGGEIYPNVRGFWSGAALRLRSCVCGGARAHRRLLAACQVLPRQLAVRRLWWLTA